VVGQEVGRASGYRKHLFGGNTNGNRVSRSSTVGAGLGLGHGLSGRTPRGTVRTGVLREIRSVLERLGVGGSDTTTTAVGTIKGAAGLSSSRPEAI